MTLTDSDLVRFYTKIAITPDAGCWEWVAGCFAETGYGQFTAGGKHKAHRLMYELEIGPIPPGAVIRHRCDNPRCVRPDHLVPGTHQENAKDRVQRGRMPRPIRRVTKDQRRVAMRARRRGTPAAQIARELGISVRYARLIVGAA